MGSEKTPSAAETEEPSYIVQLFRGDVPLPITYWIFGVVISLGFRIPRRIIESNYLDIISYPFGAGLIVAFGWFVFGYGLFIFVAIWRSAGKFEGNKFWAILARIIIVFNLIAIVNDLYLNYVNPQDPKELIAEQLRLVNRSLPRMVDNDTRLDRISIFDNRILYNFTLIHVDAWKIDINRLEGALTPVVKLGVCENKDTKKILDNDMELVYAYYDKANNPVVTIAVNNQDCNQPAN